MKHKSTVNGLTLTGVNKQRKVTLRIVDWPTQDSAE